jgi:predicted HicB family RNase H-like nuclease
VNHDPISDQCSDSTQEFNLRIPCRLAERIEAYAKEAGSSIEGVVIEALDEFLRGNKNHSF